MTRAEMAALAEDGVGRLLSIDTLFRVPSFVKSLQPIREQSLLRVLSKPLPPLSLTAETNALPADAKPAEVRENVAAALRFASGSWVNDYIVTSLAEEERSDRCRIELVRQLSERELRVGAWFEQLSAQSWTRIVEPSQSSKEPSQRLADILSGIVKILREKRRMLEVDLPATTLLDKFCGTILLVPKNKPLPPRIEECGVAIATCLDELLLTNLSMITEPSAYVVLRKIRNWWAPRPYPDNIVNALEPIIDKIETAIIILARSGRRSVALADRLTEALGARTAASEALRRIVQRESALPPDASDWLLGIERTSSAATTSAIAKLQASLTQALAPQIASLLLDAEDALQAKEFLSLDEAVQLISRLSVKVRMLAHGEGLLMVGHVGDEVEYNPRSHETEDGAPPPEPKVIIIRPTVSLVRPDGSDDVVLKAVVRSRRA
ncbi:hypothetical protein SAMN05519103_02584 [Rhizobiales bacterium GAS113]|nr:hypothetical protein SAMN05519103_02584 [Rhizobiales bacterium GAS113]